MAARTRDIAGYHGAELIGQGGFSSVYRAADATHGREVAIKVLEGALGETERRRFDRERQTMGRLGAHPNIIPVYESGYTESGEGYIVMQLATGGSLGARLRAQGPLSWTEALDIMAAVAAATQVAHDSGVLHRDIKPDNILIDQFGNPKLSDFGIAAVATNATATMSTTATLAHAAPEVLQGQAPGPGVDIYALGSTLFTLIAGLPPFMRPGDEGVTAMITRALTEPPPDLRIRGVPDAVARIVERALAKSPEQRQPTAAQMAAELRAAGTGQALPPPPAAFSAAETMVAQPVITAPPPSPTNAGVGLGVGTASGPFTGPGGGAFPPPGFGHTPNPAPPTYPGPGTGPAYGHVPPQGFQTAPQGFHGGPGHVSGPVAGGPTSFQEVRSGGGGRIALILISLVAGAALLGGAAIVAARRGDGGGGTSSTTAGSLSSITTAGSTNSSVGAPTVAGGGPAVTITCPEHVVLNVRTVCTILTSDDAVSGEWNLPGFTDAAKPLETVPGEYAIYVNPNQPEAVGQTYTIAATARNQAGRETTVTHTFTVTGVGVEIANCPDQIPLNKVVYCDIVSVNATSGEWNLPGFTSSPEALQVVPGANSIQIKADQANAVGQTFTITATVRDDAGLEVSTTHDFTITAA